MVQHKAPLVDLALHLVDTVENVLLSNWLACHFGPEALEGGLALTNAGVINFVSQNAILQTLHYFLDPDNASSAVLHRMQILNFKLDPAIHYPVGVPVRVFGRLHPDQGVV